MQAQQANIDVVWQPIEGTAQELALSAPVHHLLLTGGRGWGKTECQLMRFRRLVGLGYGSHWRGIIFDREYKNLDDLVTKSKRLFRLFNDGAKFLESASSFKWVWETGEELLFRVAKKPDDYWSYHGHEYPFVGWNELTKYPDGKLYKKMLSVNRSGFDPEQHTPKKQIGHNGGPALDDNVYDTSDGKPLPPIPLEVISTTNPYGAGHNWVKRQFIDVAPYGRIVKREFEIYDPKLKIDRTIVRTQTTIFGTFRENPYLSPEYIAGLHEETDENILKAWIYGNWDIVAGGAFDDIWRKHIHVIPRFVVPDGWYVDRAFDWGSTQPYYIGWYTVANGEEVVCMDGTTICPAAGSIIQIDEIYGTKEIGTNIGLKHSAATIADKINEREVKLINQQWLKTRPHGGPADNQIRNVRESDVETIEKKMADKGVYWKESDKSPGSRKNGFQLMRDMMEAAITNEGPGMYMTDNCVAAIATIPMLERDEDDADDVSTVGEDHPYDVWRYRVLAGINRLAKVIPVKFFR